MLQLSDEDLGEHHWFPTLSAHYMYLKNFKNHPYLIPRHSPGADFNFLSSLGDFHYNQALETLNLFSYT